MHFKSPEFDTIERKDIEEAHELLKLRKRRKGILAIVLSPKETQSGAFFGGQNWEEIGRHPAMIDEYYEQINSRADFVILSTKVRQRLQELIEAGKI